MLILVQKTLVNNILRFPQDVAEFETVIREFD